MIKKLKRIMSESLDVPQEELNAESSMDNIGTWTSLAHLDILVNIEEEFDVSFDPEEYLQMTSYIKIKQILEKKGLEI